MLAEAAHNEQLDSQGRPLPLRRNLDDEIVRVIGHDVYKTQSTNLAMATNELTWLEQTPKVTKVAAMLKAAHYQVNEICQDQRPSYSTSSIRRSAMTRSNRRPSRSRFADQQRQPLQGELGGTTSTTLANMTKKSTKMSECTSTISETRHIISTGAVSLAMKRKYVGVKKTSKSSVIRMQPSSHLTPAMLQNLTVMILKGPEHSREHSKHSSGPMVSKSPGSSPTRGG